MPCSRLWDCKKIGRTAFSRINHLGLELTDSQLRAILRVMETLVAPTSSTTPVCKIGNEKLCRVTDAAVGRLQQLLEKAAKPEGALRIAVIGGGCSGLQYKMDLIDGPTARDIMVPWKTARVVIDPKSALYVSGSELDYSYDLQKGGFKLNNPNATSHCSCGASFAA
jgi:iron-sulfur cluster assembly accessory protein